jgi:protein involved in temperature-dependent protein secretion
MTLEQIEALVQRGNFTEALDALYEITSSEAPEPGHLLQQFHLEARVQRFSAAQQTLERLLQVVPDAAPAMTALGRTTRAEWFATERLTDSEKAMSRSGIGAPPPHAVGYVQATVMHAQEQYSEVAALLKKLKAEAPPTPGVLRFRDGRTAKFARVSDADDLTGPIAPIYHGEDVLDIAFSQLASIEMLERRAAFDLWWMPVELTLRDGQAFKARYPALYPGSGIAPDPAARIGQTTMWNHSLGYARALGQRDLSFTKAEGGALLVGVMQLARIDFDPMPQT